IAVIDVPTRYLNPKFLRSYLNHLRANDGFETTGSTRASLNISTLRRISVPIPPRDAQDRIVAAIDAATASTDRGVISIRAAQGEMGRLRAASREALRCGRFGGHRFTHRGRLPENWEWVAVAGLAAAEPRAITDGPFRSNLK